MKDNELICVYIETLKDGRVSLRCLSSNKKYSNVIKIKSELLTYFGGGIEDISLYDEGEPLFIRLSENDVNSEDKQIKYNVQWKPLEFMEDAKIKEIAAIIPNDKIMTYDGSIYKLSRNHNCTSNVYDQLSLTLKRYQEAADYCVTTGRNLVPAVLLWEDTAYGFVTKIAHKDVTLFDTFVNYIGRSDIGPDGLQKMFSSFDRAFEQESKDVKSMDSF